jgi:ABC-2 type transport system ATP-binding protein
MIESEHILEVTELTKVYRGRTSTTAVDRLSFTLERGEILGLLGPNGAGKTTTIQMLLSTLKPTSGRILYFGKSLNESREEILNRVGYASAYARLPWRLTVEENLDVFGRLYCLSASERKARIQELLTWFGVWDLRRRTITGLSAGEATRVMLVKAFLARPAIALLDEPTASLDPDIAHEVRRFVRSRRDVDGVSMLYTSHNMDEVADVCNRVIFLNAGRIVAVGPPHELAASAAAARVRLRVEEGIDRLLGYTATRGLSSWVQDGSVDIELDERHVADFLTDIAAAGVRYSQISLRKPSLEDYFLKLAGEVNRNGRREQSP